MLDSDASTEDADIQLKSKLKTNSESQTDTESESESDEGLTSDLRIVPYYMDENMEMTNGDQHKTNSNNNSTKQATNSVKETHNDINVAVAEAVMNLLRNVGLNAEKLSDEQMEQYIKYVMKTSFPNNVNPRTGSVETLSCSDSNDSQCTNYH